MDLSTFLSHAAKLEFEAHRHYASLAEAAAGRDIPEVAAFLHEMAEYAELHFKQVLRRAGAQQMNELSISDYLWPEGTAPESLDGNILDLDSAMQQSLRAEQRGRDFYACIAATAADPEVVALAEDFCSEEAEHITALERFMGARPY